MNDPSQKHVEVAVGRLEVGMFVTELDRPWLETPFALQGFHVRSPTDIDTLSHYCDFVFVDPQRGRRAPHDARFRQPRKAVNADQPGDSRGKRVKPRKRVEYTNSVAMRDEFIIAKTDLESASAAISKVFDRLRSGGPLEVTAVSRAINPLIDSVLRNNDAMAALMRIRKKDDYTFGHCLSTAVWAAILGRHIGLDKETLKTLALGAALTDVGKVRVDDALLAQSSALSIEQLQRVREHVNHSMDIVRAANVEPAVLEIVRYHHERHDGSGYLEGIADAAIPLMARIAGLADSYDAMITARPYAPARSSFQAMQELSDLKDINFQAELVEQFMQAIGLFPTGSLVELNTGEVGIVVAQNGSRRLKPKVMVVLGSDKRRRSQFNIIDLALVDGADATVWIARDLPPGTHGVEAEEFYL
jgi:HD-GYP domain-containing protein (c-di-GMP phosphodiesterase class II)